MTIALSALVLPDAWPISSFLRQAKQIEACGVRTLWTYDHLSWGDLRGGPWFGALPLLTAAAMATRSLRIGTQVASPNFRHPVTFAKELVTLDHLSEGRVEVGVGAGAVGPDSRVLGAPALSMRERGDRFADWLALFTRLLDQDVTDYEGTYYTAIDARQIPGSSQRPRPPITVAAAGPRALQLVAQYADGWVTYGGYPSTPAWEAWYKSISEQSARLDDLILEKGRAPSSLRRIVQLPLDVQWPYESADSYRSMLARLDKLGVNEVTIHWPRPDGRGVPTQRLASVLEAHGLRA